MKTILTVVVGAVLALSSHATADGAAHASGAEPTAAGARVSLATPGSASWIALPALLSVSASTDPSADLEVAGSPLHRSAFVHRSPSDDPFTAIDDDAGPRFLRRAVFASAAVAAASAAVAHWSSGKGDDAYDRYLGSAGSTRREKAFDEAERYDRIAGASFLLMEASLVLTAYYVFF